MLCTVSITVLYCDMSRFMNPEGERYLWTWQGGQIDFSYPYLGARALLAGVNPYVNGRPEFTHQIFEPKVVNGVPYKQVYPPGSLTTLVPMAALYGDDWRAAARLWFRISLLSLAVLGWVAWRLVRRVTGAAVPWALALVFLFCLTLDPAAAFALERGQAEIFAAALCWSAVLLSCRGRFGEAIFLAAWAASMKGYAILFAAGLGFIAFDRGAWRAAFVGGGAALVSFVLPCAAWLGDASRATWARASTFETYWFNHSYRHLAYRLLGPTQADLGKLVAVSIALAATILAFIQAVRAFRDGNDEARALWLTAFSVSALATVVGFSDESVTYNFVLLTPGLLVLGTTLERWAGPLSAHPALFRMLGVVVAVTWWLCFVHRLGGEGAFTGFPATALGLVLVNVLVLMLAGVALRRPVVQA